MSGFTDLPAGGAPSYASAPPAGPTRGSLTHLTAAFAELDRQLPSASTAIGLIALRLDLDQQRQRLGQLSADLERLDGEVQQQPDGVAQNIRAGVRDDQPGSPDAGELLADAVDRLGQMIDGLAEVLVHLRSVWTTEAAA